MILLLPLMFVAIAADKAGLLPVFIRVLDFVSPPKPQKTVAEPSRGPTISGGW